ncbi:MAG: S41 family peptidase [Bacteroidales bacterium]|nr:S41 family peptidase [Bacteroidales bacterium]
MIPFSHSIKRALFPFIAILAIIFFLLGLVLVFNNFEISKNLDIYTTLFRELNINYVDEINSGELMEAAINAMLESLDPYTIYIPESEVEDYRFMTTGQYGGIGALIHKQGDYVVISEPYEGFPAHKAGLKAGDRILKINNKSAKGKSSADVSKVLKGSPGTTLKILIERNGEPKPIEKEIIREKIKIENIPYYGMLNDDIAYIKLTGFTQNAAREVKNSFLKLKENNDVKSLILDLRGNGGGLMNEAVDITNIFVEKDKEVVSTKGKLSNRNKSHKTRYAPVDLSIPLVVLINQASASASEIVAGAIQDLDRGVILGQRTFGKGLVQNVIPLSYNSKVKVTVAKYYIPSGRCIQAIDYSLKDENGHFNKIPDSLITAFKTQNGRTVYDGGGIEPDIKLTPLKFSNIAISLFTKFLIFDYANKFFRENPEIPPADEFIITDQIFDDFKNYISDKNYDYTTESEKTLEKLKKHAEKEKYFDAIQSEYETLKMKMKHDKDEDLNKYKDQIKELLKIEIVSRYYYQKGKIIASIANDPEIKEAMEILENKTLYESILNGTYQKNEDN